MPLTDSREPGAPLYSCSVHEAPGLSAGHGAKEQRSCLRLCMGTAPFTPQFLFGKLAILDVGGVQRFENQGHPVPVSVTYVLLGLRTLTAPELQFPGLYAFHIGLHRMHTMRK